MKYGNHRINVRTVRNFQPDDGITLKNGYPVVYKTGYIVAVAGIECDTPEDVSKAIRSAEFNGNCGIWRNPETGRYCVDHYVRVYGKTNAHILGAQHNQYSVFNCAKGEAERVLAWIEDIFK